MDKIIQIIAELSAKMAELTQAVHAELESRPAKVEVVEATPAAEAPKDETVEITNQSENQNG